MMTASNDIRDTAGVVSDGGAVVSVAGICEHHRKIGQREGGGSGSNRGGVEDRGGNREAIK